MILVLDVENSTTPKEKGNDDVSPYNPNNRLVSIGVCGVVDGAIVDQDYRFFYHREFDDPSVRAESYRAIQERLDNTTLLVGHNLKHDLNWLLATGFTYDGPVWDTKVFEYVLARGLKEDTTLDGSAERRNVTRKRHDLTADYLAKGIGFDKMPMAVVEEYGRGEIQTTAELFLAQKQAIERVDNVILKPTLDMSLEFLTVLAQIERNGIYIDREALEEVRKEFEAERADLTRTISEQVYRLMGDRPINLASPEQLSMVLYSRQVKDKKKWAETFNLGTDDRGKKKRKPRMPPPTFAHEVRSQTERLTKQKAHQCNECKGTGYYYRTKINGDFYKKPNKCQKCNATGLVYSDLKAWAGLRLTPRGPMDTASGGFATDKATLEHFAEQARIAGNERAETFLRSIIRLNALDTYLSSFVGGIERGVVGNILHCKFNQTITATGRLSSSEPNMQNFPKKKFPVRKTFKSRFKGGKIMECDWRQLEYRMAGILSGDEQIKRDVLEGIDVHQRAADTLTEAGQPTSRQEAKARTFAPIYGATSGTPAEIAYYNKLLTEFCPGLGRWHRELENEALSTGMVTLPTGRQYSFPYIKRTSYGVTGGTRLKNFPVQGAATADLVPISVIMVATELNRRTDLRSLLINTVHDSVVLDVYPGEEVEVAFLVVSTMLSIDKELERRYNYQLTIPLGLELSIGDDWYNQSEIMQAEQTGWYHVDEKWQELQEKWKKFQDQKHIVLA